MSRRVEEINPPSVELANYGELQEQDVGDISLSNTNNSNNGEAQVVRLQPPKGARRLRLHLRLLLQKNFIITQRNLRNTVFLLLSPLLIVLTLILWQYMIDMMTKFEIREPELMPNEHLLPCIPPLHSDDRSCITVAYAVVGQREAWVDYVMEYVAVTNGLQFGKDVAFVAEAKSPQQFNNYLLAHPNRTKLGVVFCTSDWPILERGSSAAQQFGNSFGGSGIGNSFDNLDLSLSLPCHFDELDGKKLVFYSMYWNWTLNWRSPYLQDFKASYPKDRDSVRLKTSIDNALFQLYASHSANETQEIVKNADESRNLLPRNFTERLSVVLQDYPKMTSRFAQGYDMASFNGAIYFFIPIMLHFIISVNEILREKEKRLRQGITVMGMKHSVYWLSWIVTAAIITSLLVTIQLIVCAIFGFTIVLKTPFLINFALYFLFGMSFQSIGIFLTTVCADVKNGYTAAYGFMLLSLIMQVFLTTGFFVDYLYIEDAELYIVIVRFFLNIYPAFHYSKVFGDISYLSGTYFDMTEGRWKQGTGYEWSDLVKVYSGKFVTGSSVRTFTEPSTLASLSYLLYDSIIFLFLAWYFDHVLPGNRGTVDSPLFLCTPDYWRTLLCPRRNHSLSLRQQQQPQVQANAQVQAQQDSVVAETERVIAAERNGVRASGLRVVKLGKTYHRYPFGIRSTGDVQALSDVHLEVQQGEILAILGHNGAGKSTLINVLTGILSPSTGIARVLDFDIRNDMEHIRTLMGVCPQFDILWDELTAEEHLRMYCLLKGVADEDVETEVRARLQQVEMYAYRKARISTLSGGQKRRISISISAIGDPRLIYLDEPTTGMDPKTRRGVWKMIKELRRGRSIILTTHGMDEADALADRIAVISEGNFRCIGSSLYLKNNFGDGYRLTLVIEPQHTEFLRQQICILMPSARILDDSGGSIIVCVPVRQQQELKNLFKILEADNPQSELSAEHQQLRSYVQNFGLSHSTLEEVFMKITKKNSRYYS